MAAIAALMSLTSMAPPVAADPPAANSGGTPQVAQLVTNPVYDPRPYNAPVYTPLDLLGMAFGIYNTPVYTLPSEVGGFYFGPSGSLSVLRDSDLIKRFEPRTSDTLLSMPSTRSGISSSWLRSSGTSETSRWASTSTPWLLSTEGGSKTKQLTSSIGYDVGARAGYQLFPNVRTEFQFDYANNSVDTFGNANRTSDFVMRDRTVSGSTTGMTFLINAFIDVNVPYLQPYGMTPYFGGGIGAGQTSLDLKWGSRTIVNSSDWGVAYQLGAGVNWQIAPTWSLDIGYRFRGISDVTLRNEFEKINVPYSSHNFEVSALWKTPAFWGAPGPATPYVPPPPPPLLPPPPPRPPG